MTVWSLLLAVFVLSWVLTMILRRYALAKSLMDIPNERSSHSVPTPRGGGVAIVAAFLLVLPVLAQLNLINPAALWGLSGSGLLIAVLGFIDDHGHIAARWRLIGHFVAAAWALYWLNGLPAILLWGINFDPGWIGCFLALIYLVWMLNLYNFMDGIDGLASAEAMSVCLGMCLVYYVLGCVELIWPPLMLAAAVGGFLWWNFPPAKIFMGDAGSGFLGIILAVLSLQGAWSKPELLFSWVILLGVFIVDATWTLGRRLLRGDKVYQAHSSHAYQHAARSVGHKKVTLAVVMINVLFLLPLSMFVALGMLSVITALLIAFTPLIYLAYRFGAGKA
ncbi:MULTISPECIES: MraY family glycosyltransferase [Pseudomonas]|uniref:MraY family glycosyltransferase n=1 Tax=Pseudomonas TaxID=286 RepID=UPI001B340E0C|nr:MULTISPECIES: glycosyltransferase family 4 protein [Pseudomonas]MBP5945332.1 glycosyltransferase family 4 protein [Pseudomonas sp. P9(2020)]MBP5955738.1 glycosyltransferase family 4 protein [Pseudomonas anatoliensis]MBZ9563794.1 glycosyltransferase family 4 protein [Pseudomonas sp. P116]